MIWQNWFSLKCVLKEMLRCIFVVFVKHCKITQGQILFLFCSTHLFLQLPHLTEWPVFAESQIDIVTQRGDFPAPYDNNDTACCFFSNQIAIRAEKKGVAGKNSKVAFGGRCVGHAAPRVAKSKPGPKKLYKKFGPAPQLWPSPESCRCTTFPATIFLPRRWLSGAWPITNLRGPECFSHPWCFFFDRTAEHCIKCSRAGRIKAQTAVLPHLHGEGPVSSTLPRLGHFETLCGASAVFNVWFKVYAVPPHFSRVLAVLPHFLEFEIV